MIKFEKTMKMQDFMDRILPFTPWAPYDLMRWAIEMANNGEDYFCIVRDIKFNIPRESVLEYAKEHGADTSFDQVDDPDANFKAAMEGLETEKRKPGRPKKATQFDPIPDELK